MNFLLEILKTKLLVYFSVIVVVAIVGLIISFHTHVLSFSSADRLSNGLDAPNMPDHPQAFADARDASIKPSDNREIHGSQTSSSHSSPTPTQNIITPSTQTDNQTPHQQTSAPTTADPTPTSNPNPTPTSNVGNMINTFVTYYGWADNTPPGTDIAFPGFPNTVHTAAGGVGTYADPVTMASDQNVWPVGTRMYIPYIKKYVIMEDICGGCTNNKSTGEYHIDIWMNSDSRNTDKLLDCENSYTRQSVQAEVNPSSDREVNTTPLFDPATGKCLAL